MSLFFIWLELFASWYSERIKIYITLTPEEDNLMKVNDFRPINLYNVAYKFISKLLTKRLREFLLKLFPFCRVLFFFPNKDSHDKILSIFLSKKKKNIVTWL